MSEPGELSRGLAKDLEYLHDCEDALFAIKEVVHLLNFKVLGLKTENMNKGAIEMHERSIQVAKDALEKMNNKWWFPAHE